MILSFKHKGLQRFHGTGDMRGIQSKHVEKLKDILDVLDAATCPDDLRLPGFLLHLLEPRKAGIYAIKVSGNWRVTFRMRGSNVEIVDYLDYH